MCISFIKQNYLWIDTSLIIQGDKNIIKFDGDHNSPRPQFYYDSITIFFYNVLHPPDAPVVPEVPEPIFFGDALDIDDLDEVNLYSPHCVLYFRNSSIYS